MDGRHVLALGSPIGGVATGAFDHRRWTVDDGAEGHELASLHEWAHAFLNDSTSWGTLLAACVASAHGSAHGTLRILVRACRRTHESYATFQSTLRSLGTAASAQDALRRYPDYATYLATALSLAPAGTLDSDVRAATVSAALTACMQSPALSYAVEVGMADFRPADLPLLARPDARLRLLRRAAGEGRLWNGEPWADGPTVDTDTGRGMPAIFVRETLRLRPPRAARVVRRGVPTPREGASGPHLFLSVRRPSQLRRQFRLADGGRDLPTGDDPVAVLVRPDAADPERRELLLVELTDVDTLDTLGRDPVLVAVSMHCLLDDAWREAWLTPLTAVGTLGVIIDLPFDACWEFWRRQGLTVTVRSAIVLAAGVARPVLTVGVPEAPPLLLPVGVTAAVAWSLYVQRSGGPAVEPTELAAPLADIAMHTWEDDAQIGAEP